jgi:lipase maturation factor 1
VLGAIYLIAFWSLGTQIVGLVGDRGILPAHVYMAAARTWAASQHIGLERFHLLPTLCWISTSDAFLKGLCVSGAALSLLLLAGIAPIVVLPILWIEYLSLSVICREFLSYQWDALLLETGLLAIALAPLKWIDWPRARDQPPRVAVWLMLWLLFRLMLGSGLVKLASGDPTWRSLTALTYHYETQPIPSPVAAYAHQLPAAFQKVSTLATLAIELAAPFMMFGPRRMRIAAFLTLVSLQALIAATGNYAFFNLLAAALCVFLIGGRSNLSGDVDVEVRLKADSTEVFERDFDHDLSGPLRRMTILAHRAFVIALAAIVFPVSAYRFAASVGVLLPGGPLVEPVASSIEPFRSVNSYGLFAVMTTTRPEIIVEGSDDGEHWLPYEFKYKPGDVRRQPPFVAPHQPRLDWQMWFAALGSSAEAPWFESFCQRLLEGSPDVLRLLHRDPFGGRPPRYIRASLYQYHFADRATHVHEGVWWRRELVGEYLPALSLR